MTHSLAPKSFWAGEHLEAEFVNFVVSRGRSRPIVIYCPRAHSGSVGGIIRKGVPKHARVRPTRNYRLHSMAI